MRNRPILSGKGAFRFYGLVMATASLARARTGFDSPQVHYISMIDRYTIKFGPAVSQKELEKALNEGKDSPQIAGLHKLKARLDIVCDYKDLHTLDEFIKHMKDMERVPS